MTKIYSVTDHDVSFVYSTLGWGVQGLSEYLTDSSSVHVYSYDELKQRKIIKDVDDDVVFICEIGNPQHAGISTKELRSWFPNGKLIALASDTCYYMANNLKPQMDMEDIDLVLELMPNCIEWLYDNGARNVQSWVWTVSDKLLEIATNFGKSANHSKLYDLIGVYGQWSIDNPECWRHQAINYLRSKGYSFTQGGNGKGHNDHDFDNLFQNYCNSLFTLGTTSHNRPELTRLGCMKGFRDWLGPILGNLLIYDDHPNIVNTFNKHGLLVPTYKYDNFDSIINCIGEYAYTEDYNILVEKQKAWVTNNTIDRQLCRILYKHGWVEE